MTDGRTRPIGATEEWKGTKAPNKRAKAIQRRLAFMRIVFAMTRESWTKIPMRKLTDSHGMTNSMTFLIANGIIERKGRLYRWRGPSPSYEMAEAWCDHIMTYIRLRRDRDTAVRADMISTYAAMETADKRIAKYAAGLESIYSSLHGGFRKRSLTKLCESNGVPPPAAALLIKCGMIDRPRRGVCKWIGPPPDRELALWLYGKLSEHHRSIARSLMDKKQQRIAMIDELIGLNTPSMPTSHGPILPAPSQHENGTSVHRPYWQSSSTTW